MKVLLCTPYNINPQVVQGGIAIWAQNIVDYYQTLSTDVQIEVVPYDRKARKRSQTYSGLLKRAWQGIIDYRGAIKQTRKQLKDKHFDVLHLCTSASISLAKDLLVLRLTRRHGVKSVVHFHFGRIPELAVQKGWEWKLLTKVVRLSDVAVIMDMRSYETLKAFGFDNVRYLPNPLSRRIMQQISTESSIVAREDRKLCFVGHVIPTKGVYELVEACKDLQIVKLCVVGKATDEVEQKMRQLAGDKLNIQFLGEVDHTSVIRELLSTDIFVLPSYTEGFPNVILESMACGCAIATTTVGAIPEILDINSHEPCGLCCEPKDAEGLQHNIQFFLTHPAEAREYGHRAIKRVNEFYAVEKVWELLKRIWKI